MIGTVPIDPGPGCGERAGPSDPSAENG
jgi:hypothetical protein